MSEKMEILSERLFLYDRDAVFEAFCRPERLAAWWGPDGFTNTVTRFDFRPGGNWDMTMTASDGTDFHNISIFRDIVVTERIVFEHLEPMHVYLMDMTLREDPSGTMLRWRMTFEATEELVHLKPFIAAANEQNFDRLERVLKASPASS